jgi:glycosyltransferase involved in cell wall biosynthesis
VLLRPLRVAVDANSLAWGWGGIPRYTDRICRELAGSGGIELTLLTNASGPLADMPGLAQAWGRRKGGSVWRNTFVAPWLVRHRPDVYWAPETLMPLWVPTPSVVTVHDLATALLPATKPVRLRLSYRLTLPRTTRRATRVIAVSQSTADDVVFRWRVDPAKVRVVPNGVDEQFRPGDRLQAAARVRERFGLDRPFVLAVGTVEPRKGIELLVETAAAAARQGREWTFVLVGAPGFRGERLSAAAKAAGCAVLGRIADTDLPDLYQAAEVLVAPSLHEGFGLTPLEAMASGTPAVVAGDAGALEEVSGPAAIVVRERSAAAWIAAIDEAIAQRGRLGRVGAEHAAQYAWPEVASRVREVLEEAAAGR